MAGKSDTEGGLREKCRAEGPIQKEQGCVLFFLSHVQYILVFYPKAKFKIHKTFMH